MRFKPTNAYVDGILAIREGTVYLAAWHHRHVFFYDLNGLATYLANLNIVVTDESPIVKDTAGNVLTPEEIGSDLPRTSVHDALMQSHQAIFRRAVATVQSDLNERLEALE